MSASDLLKELLQPIAARTSATLGIAATPVAWAIPHLASPLWPNSSQAEILLSQTAAALLTMLLGSLFTLIFIIAHERKLAHELAATKQEVTRLTIKASKQVKNDEARFHTQKMDTNYELILNYVASTESKTFGEMSRSLAKSDQLALHILEELLNYKYVSDSYLQGTDITGAKYRREWRCEAAGRKYLAFHGIIK